MKKLLIMALVSTNAMALDFDTEWAKFKDDFAKLRSKPSTVTLLEPNPVVPVEDGKVVLVDPKSKDRLGRNLENPYMRDKMEKLYNDPNVVVYSTTVR